MKSFSTPLGNDISHQPFVTDGVTIPNYRVARELENHGRRVLTIQFVETPGAIALAEGWQPEPMTLEDVFIAMVTAARTTTHD